LSVLQESFFAGASNDAVLGANWARMWVSACGWACSSASLENFIGIAFRDWWHHHVLDRVGLWWAFESSNAFSAIVFAEKSLFASASRFADTWAHGVGVLAGTIATFALTVFFVFLALFHWWHHHESFRLNLSGAFTGGNAFTGIITEMTFFAGATSDADTWAQGVGVLAGSIASFALTVFFIIAAHFGCHGSGFGSWHAARFRLNAHTVFVFQESGFAEATDDAVAGADWARVRVGAGGRAGGSAGEEHFVFFALRKFWWVSEELHGWGSALIGWHAGTTGIAQMTFFAEASDDALSGTNWARVWVSAGRGASGAAGIEKFIGWAFWFGLRELHGDFVVTGLAFFHAYAFTFGVFQESLVTETTDDALEGTKGGLLGVGTIWYAGGSASQKFGIGTAFFIDGKSRCGDSEPEGTNGQQ
jgi:hypothetical protein